jgi:hypothetical protein
MFRTTSAGTVSSDSTFVGIGVETCSERMLQRPVPAPVFALLLPADRAPELADAASG